MKVAEFWPAGIVTFGGTLTTDELEVRVKLRPPVEAGTARVTVPVTGVPEPEITWLGLITRLVTLCDLTSNETVFVTPL